VPSSTLTAAAAAAATVVTTVVEPPPEASLSMSDGIEPESLVMLDSEADEEVVAEILRFKLHLRVLGKSRIQPGNREWVIVIQVINATSWIIPPFLVFTG
jgi:hypothetical protein